MDFYEVVRQVLELLQQQRRVSYRAMKRHFGIDDEYIEDLQEEFLYAHASVVEVDDRGFVWIGDTDSAATSTPVHSPPKPAPTSPPPPEQEREPLSYTPPHLAEKILQSKAALEGERKQVTVLFCDLVNSIDIAEKIGAENMHTLLNRFFELSLEEVHRYEGTINQFLGDGFMALFGAPIAHEDHARRAVLAAMGLQERLQAQQSELGTPSDETLAMRIGLNTGPVVVGSIGDNLRMDYTAIGDTTNVAARLQQLAKPNTILISESTRRLVHGIVHTEALSPTRVKGKTAPMTPYHITGLRPRRSPIIQRGERALSPFVGRERELSDLIELFEIVERGQGQVVGIVGEAGQGKSRLCYEFKHHLQAHHVTYLEGRCLSYDRVVPYHPRPSRIRALKLMRHSSRGGLRR